MLYPSSSFWSPPLFGAKNLGDLRLAQFHPKQVVILWESRRFRLAWNGIYLQGVDWQKVIDTFCTPIEFYCKFAATGGIILCEHVDIVQGFGKLASDLYVQKLWLPLVHAVMNFELHICCSASQQQHFHINFLVWHLEVITAGSINKLTWCWYIGGACMGELIWSAGFAQAVCAAGDVLLKVKDVHLISSTSLVPDVSTDSQPR